MNAGLVSKIVREIALVTILAGAGLMIFETLISYVFWTYQQELTDELMQIDFVRDLIQSLVGANYDAPLGPESLMSLAWVHPLVLAVVFAHSITSCTRVPSGEVDRGTADFLFTLPVSRLGIYRVEVAGSLLASLLVIALGSAGSAIGYRFVPPEGRPDPVNVAWILVNLYLLMMTVAGMATLFSTISDRRGRSIGASFAVVLSFLIWNFLAQYWELADRALFLNILAYYRPLPILTDGSVPWRDFAVLGTCAGLCWVAGGVVLSRRDICTT
jgi:ABC-type transport system involved in multi-copper enzyme maturation permease subunit